MIRKYISSMISWAIVGGICYALVRWIQARRRRCELDFPKECKRTAFAAYIVGTASRSLAPEAVLWTESRDGYRYINIRMILREGRYNLIPFRTLWAQLTGDLPLGADAAFVGRVNLLFNLLVFVPLGIFLPMLFRKGQRWYSVLCIAAVTSVSVEVIQYLIGRTCDIDDVLLNVAGCMIGYAAYRIARYVLKARDSLEII